MTKKAFEEEEEVDCDKRTDLLEMLISARDDSDHGMSEEMMVDEVTIISVVCMVFIF